MKQSTTFIPTLRETPADAEVKSHQLLLRAGFIRQTASGVYSYLPLGFKVLKKIEEIVRDEMDDSGASEMLMPTLQPAELWQESGRWDAYGPELMRMKDRNGRDFSLGPTHEEVITSLIRDEIKSYKRMPLVVYQIQTKFRDEKRPRFGLLRGREFVMKDAYSFHATKESLDKAYDTMYDTYSKIFSRLSLNFRAVLADSGAMGGKDTHEFMMLSDVGEDTIAYSDKSSYAANREMAEVITTYEKSNEELMPMEKIHTPEQTTIAMLSEFLNIEATKSMKSLLFKVDDSHIFVIACGNHEVNPVKLKNYCSATIVELATPEEAKSLLGCPFGSLGPVGISTVKVIADNAVQSIVNGVCGANEEGYHYKNVNPGRDFTVDYADLRFIEEGDPSPDGKGTIQFAKGIELGHIFKLGTRYSDSMGAMHLNETGSERPIIMGCYGIGISRLVAAIAEHFNDEKGLTWPPVVAPYQIHVITVNQKDETQRIFAEQIYDDLRKLRLEVLYDDRYERAGVKFADSDLIGIPIRIIVGKQAGEQIVEVKSRLTGISEEIHFNHLHLSVARMLTRTAIAMNENVQRSKTNDTSVSITIEDHEADSLMFEE